MLRLGRMDYVPSLTKWLSSPLESIRSVYLDTYCLVVVAITMVNTQVPSFNVETPNGYLSIYLSWHIG